MDAAWLKILKEYNIRQRNVDIKCIYTSIDNFLTLGLIRDLHEGFNLLKVKQQLSFTSKEFKQNYL